MKTIWKNKKLLFKPFQLVVIDEARKKHNNFLNVSK